MSETAEKRMNRIISVTKLNKQILHIDLYNVLYTLAAYLRGFPVFISSDSLVRDASESHGSGEWEVHLLKGLELLMEDLDRLKIKKAVIYVDNPLEHYLVIFERLKVLSNRLKPEIKIIADQSPDHLIREAKDGIIATSDSTIIDKSSQPVFDLPRSLLEFHFEPKLIRLIDLKI